MSKRDETSIIWPFGHRNEYLSRIKIAGAEFGYPKGPNSANHFHWEKTPYRDRSKNWGAAYIEELRELALSYWVGSEYDIALIRKEKGVDKNWPTTRLFHVFDALTHGTLQLDYGFKWSDDKSCHIFSGEVDYLRVITFLLTYYNAVFFDDTIKGESWINYPSETTERTPQKIKIHDKGTEEQKYIKEEMRTHIIDQEQTGFCIVDLKLLN